MTKKTLFFIYKYVNSVGTIIVVLLGTVSVFTFNPSVANAVIPIVVNDLGDADGMCVMFQPCTLRQAINTANSGASNVIFFHDSVVGGTIMVNSPLPDITYEPTLIDALAASFGQTRPTPAITIDGTNAGLGASGFTIKTNYVTIRGFAITRFNTTNGRGIFISGSAVLPITGTVIDKNYVGVASNGSTAQANKTGVYLNYANNSTITSNIVSGNSGDGISLDNSSTNIIKGNRVGVSAGGTTRVPNQNGIHLQNNSNSNTIGGVLTADSDRNVLSGNLLDGICSSNANSNTITGNYIGPNSNGTALAGSTQQHGVWFNTSSGNVVGGITSASRNVISGNTVNGILTTSGTEHLIQGNYLGTTMNGSVALPNLVGLGIGSTQTQIGGTGGAKNIIAGNSRQGIIVTSGGSDAVIYGNDIGVSANGSSMGNGWAGIHMNGSGGMIQANQIKNNGFSGNNINGWGGVWVVTQGSDAQIKDGNIIVNNRGNGVTVTTISGSALRVLVSSNNIFGNQSYNGGSGVLFTAGLGINLNPLSSNDDGVTANDTGDGDTGPNNLQNFPVITSVITNGTTVMVSGTLNSEASKTFAIDFYKNTASGRDPLGYGEGEDFLETKSILVMTDGSGNASFQQTFTTSELPAGSYVATTAYHTSNGTSEFSADVQVQ